MYTTFTVDGCQLNANDFVRNNIDNFLVLVFGRIIGTCVRFREPMPCAKVELAFAFTNRLLGQSEFLVALMTFHNVLYCSVSFCGRSFHKSPPHGTHSDSEFNHTVHEPNDNCGEDESLGPNPIAAASAQIGAVDIINRQHHN